MKKSKDGRHQNPLATRSMLTCVHCGTVCVSSFFSNGGSLRCLWRCDIGMKSVQARGSWDWGWDNEGE